MFMDCTPLSDLSTAFENRSSPYSTTLCLLEHLIVTGSRFRRPLLLSLVHDPGAPSIIENTLSQAVSCSVGA
ncbi:hypothetical protein LshimejAT787_0705400 [Lyophyllum shimeji]|uniref:Uncharacterized protein n=1 Tax=Lyophyllum shimeji TaxID=47721 RepID=A0A9P3UQC4_LYOSH|nr:hypothetical protein LshimejAT787_0705400 [Lyophyllum shimeji]